MEIKITTSQVLKILQVFSWIIYIGLCIEAGGIMVNTFISLFVNPNGVHNFWSGADYLSALYTFDRGQFAVITICMTIVAVLKATLFHLVIKLFTEKKLNMSQPFTAAFHKFIVTFSYLALGIGFFAHGAKEYLVWLTKQGVPKADLQALNLDGSDVWLFMAVILFVIGQIIKKGVEIQTENELTI